MKGFVVLILVNLIVLSKAWDQDDLEILDVVEEVNQNFYTLMDISQESTSQDIKRAFRNLSIILHPDKSDAEDANIKFRNLVAVYEVLKDKTKREKYDGFLKNGFPNWRSSLYYYRRVRKLGLFEGSVIVFLIITIGQYFFAWAAYLEQKYTAEQIFGLKAKKLQKKNIKLDNLLSGIPLPSIFNTLPFQIPKFIWNFPTMIKNLMGHAVEYKKQMEEEKRLLEEEREEQLLLEKEYAKEREAKKEFKEILRKRKKETSAPVKTDEDLIGYSKLRGDEANYSDVTPAQRTKQLNGGLWTDDDLAELVHLVKKYPVGTLNRWQIIGEHMNRNVAEVTFMAAKMKEVAYKMPGREKIEIPGPVVETKKTKRKHVLVADKNWSQEQQQALETALTKYKTSSNDEKWQLIASAVPDKTREECIARYKYLVDLLKKQRTKQSSENENAETETTTENAEVTIEKHADKEAEVEYVEEVNSTDSNENHTDEKSQRKKAGKPKNLRRERRKQITYSSEDSD